MARIDKFASAATVKAVRAIAKTLGSWSYSRYQVYVQCPLKAKLKFLLKLKEPPADALMRGNIIHKQAELFIKGLPAPMLTLPYVILDKHGNLPAVGVKYHKKGELPPELAKFSQGFEAMAKRYKQKSKAMVLEETWAFRKDWSITTGTDFEGCELRIKVDCACEEDGDILFIRDWKTGKFNAKLQAEYLEALQLYSLGGLLIFPHIKEVRASLIYTDLGVTYPEQGKKPIIYTRADIPKLKALWEGRTKPMLADRAFVARPNDKCKWCAFGKQGALAAGTDPRQAPCKY